MLTPSFTVEETPAHVVVKIRVASIHCRVSEAQFDICEERLTLYCKPYYLRLRFDQPLTEGKDERATYNVDTNTLTVYAPKLHEGEPFTNLHDPAYLIATEKQRVLMNRPPAKPLIQVMGSTSTADKGDSDDDDGEDDETEYVQTLRNAALEDDSPLHADGAAAPATSYGFNMEFADVFGGLDETTVYDAIELRQPDRVPHHERRALRIADEQKSFHEEAMWYSLADEEGEVDAILHGAFVPHYVRTFEQILARDGVKFITPSRRYAAETRMNDDDETNARRESGLLPRDAAEEDDGVAEGAAAVYGSRIAEVPVWSGNIASFDVLPSNDPQIQSDGLDVSSPYGMDEVGDDVSEYTVNGSAASPLTPARRIAAPSHPVEATFDMEESDMLARLLPSSVRHRDASKDLVPPHEGHVMALTLDLLLAFSYDHLTSEGTSSSESVWTVCKLSPSLSWLDTQDSLYDVCVVFARRVLIFPLHRHLNLIRRCFRDVGVMMLLGPSYVVKSLLAIKYMMDRSEHKMVLSTIFLNPLLRYWQRKPRAAAMALLHSTALELHDIATRHTPAKPKRRPHQSSTLLSGLLDQRSAAVQRLVAQGEPSADAMELPITITTLGLPIHDV
jgi:protein SHQ1